MPKPWDQSELHSFIAERMSGMKFIAVSNREPYIHQLNGTQIECVLPASGMATAIDPIMRASGGTWVAHGSGSADRLVVDENDRIPVPPGEESYTLRRVWVDEEIEKGFYWGLSNSGLWPLCHIVYHRPIFRLPDWEQYRQANQLFAEAVLQEADGKPAFVFIQDYHFALLPRMLKEQNPNLVVAQFWHIPWPNKQVFRAFPWKEELLDGMLGNDLMSFHLRYQCSNFLAAIDQSLEAITNWDQLTVTRGGRVSMVRPFPISIDFARHERDAASHQVEIAMAAWLDQLGGRPAILGAGIDRLDYTKGIPDRLLALDILLENDPGLRGKLVFVQIAVPSRSLISDYGDLEAQVDAQVSELNAKWGQDGWKPIVYLKRHYGQAQMMALHRLADFFLVTALHDGMNLVAKEFVASRFDDAGVLVLSQFTGAAGELTDALLVNPFAPDEVAKTLARAITMPAVEQASRMRSLRLTVQENNVYRWAGKLLSALLKIEMRDRHESEDTEVADLEEA